MRLIDADVANKWMKRNNAFIDSYILKAIPTIDPLDALGICRCKDCIYFKHNPENVSYCAYRYGLVDPKEIDYCPYAKKRKIIMFDFENKPIKDWTLAEAKEYCKNHIRGDTYCLGKDCILNNAESCIGFFIDMKLKDNTILSFTSDEIAFCRLIKKTYPWAKYITRNKFNDLKFIELFPRFDKEGRNEIGTTGCFITIQSDFFPQIKPLAYYSIDDIIKQGENNLD